MGKNEQFNMFSPENIALETTIKNKEVSPCERIITHDGLFHFDELKALAVLKKLYPEAEIIRTRDKKILDEAKDNQKTILIDVGEEYSLAKQAHDHHQKDFDKKRETSGIKYASAGLVWENYGHEFLQKIFQEKGIKIEAETLTEVWKYLDRKWMEIVDAMDNGELTEDEITINDEERSGFDYTPNGIIRSFHPIFKIEGGNQKVMTQAFENALKFTETFLDRITLHSIEAIRTRKEIQKKAVLLENDRIMVLQENLKWKETIDLFPKVEYVVVKSGGGKWSVMTAPVSPESRTMRNGTGFPIGMRDYKEKVFGDINPDDIIMFHQAGFLAMTKSQESAEKLAKHALNYYGNQLEMLLEEAV